MLGLLSLLSLLSLIGSRRRNGSLFSLRRNLGLVLAVLGNELNNVLNSPGAAVGDGLLLSTGGVQLDGGEALDLIRDVVACGVNLGDDDLVLELRVGIQAAKLLVLGSESLAVTAPRSVELNQDILGVVEDDLFVVLGDDDGDRAVIGLRDVLGLDAGLQLAVNKVLGELLNILLGDLLVLVEGELLVLLNVLDGESGELVGLEVQVASVGAELLRINSGKVDDATVGLGDSLQLLAQLLALLWALSEDVGKRDLGGHVVRVGLRTNLADQRGGRSLGELLNGLNVELLREDSLALVKVLVQDDGRGLDALGLGDGSVAGGTEGVVVTELLSDLGEGLVGGLVCSIVVGDQDDLVGLLEVLQGIGSQDGDSREGLLDHVGGDAG